MNNFVISTQNANYFNWGDGCDGWRLLQSDSLSVIQERMPPGSSEQMHFHEQAQQVFYILSGSATFEFEDGTLLVEAGQSIHIKPKTKHSIVNRNDADLHFLVISEPKTQGDRINL